MCDVDLDDCATTLDNRVVRARKQHRCDACRSVINPGDEYLTLSYAFEGSVGREKCCLLCRDVIERFGEEHRMQPFPGDLRSFLVDCVAWGDEDSKRWQADLDALNERRAAA